MKPGSTYRHVKRGTYYTVVGEVTMQCSTLRFFHDMRALDGSTWVLYQGTDGAYYARPKEEFLDGRFELIVS